MSLDATIIAKRMPVSRISKRMEFSQNDRKIYVLKKMHISFHLVTYFYGNLWYVIRERGNIYAIDYGGKV